MEEHRTDTVCDWLLPCLQGEGVYCVFMDCLFVSLWIVCLFVGWLVA